MRTVRGDGYELRRGFLDEESARALLRSVRAHVDLFRPVAVKAGMNLPYHVLAGTVVRDAVPELYDLAAGPLKEAAEKAFGVRLEVMKDTKRAVRIQRYRAEREGFRWHVDGGRFSALLTLVNTNDGGTELLSSRASRWLLPVPYLLYPFPGILEAAGPERIDAAAGDLLLLQGGRIIHRGVTRLSEGERMVLVASYDPEGTVRPKVWDTVARWMNY